MNHFQNLSTILQSLRVLESQEAYALHFMDLGLWEAAVRRVYTQHNSSSPLRISPGKAGTFPTFIVDDHWVVKFFGRLFDGEACFAVEREANRLLLSIKDFPAPRLLLEGVLSDDPPWHYLVFEYVPGVSFGEVYHQVSYPEKERVACEMARLARRLHAVPLTESPVLGSDWVKFIAFLQQRLDSCERDHRAWASLPAYLLDQIRGYLLPIEELLDTSQPPCLIHADLTGDHLIGRLEKGIWHTHALIDFGDAMTGNLFYELPALYVDLFRCDSHLLRLFLQTYGAPDSFYDRFIQKAMNYILLHRFNLFAAISDRLPPLHNIHTLAELANWICDDPFGS